MFPFKKHGRAWTSPWFYSDFLWCYKFPLNVNKEGTLLYIGSYLSYKPRNDLCIYKTVELESGIRVWT